MEWKRKDEDNTKGNTLSGTLFDKADDNELFNRLIPPVSRLRIGKTGKPHIMFRDVDWRSKFLSIFFLSIPFLTYPLFLILLIIPLFFFLYFNWIWFVPDYMKKNKNAAFANVTPNRTSVIYFNTDIK